MILRLMSLLEAKDNNIGIRPFLAKSGSLVMMHIQSGAKLKFTK